MTRSINGFRVSWVNQWQRVLAEHETVPDCAYQFLISDWKFERRETVPLTMPIEMPQKAQAALKRKQAKLLKSSCVWRAGERRQ